MKMIPLTQGKVAIVDDHNYDWLVAMGSWHANLYGHCWYAVMSLYPPRRTLGMHTAILKPPPGFEVDHRDRDGLHNWEDNLRIATRSQNNANKPKWRGSSRFKGVYLWHGKWRAQCRIGGVNTNLGTFADEIEAARAYNAAAVKAFGEFACFNEALEGPQPEEPEATAE